MKTKKENDSLYLIPGSDLIASKIEVMRNEIDTIMKNYSNVLNHVCPVKMK